MEQSDSSSKVNENLWQYEDKTKAGISLDQTGIKSLVLLDARLGNLLPALFEGWKAKDNLEMEWEAFKAGFYSYYDKLMLARFLVGKQMDVKKAEEMICRDWHWRLIEVQIDQFMIEYPKSEWFKFLSSYYPTVCHGFDQYGVEVNWERLSLIDLDSLFQNVPFKELIAFHIYAIESSEIRVRTQMRISKEYRFRRVLFEDLEGLSMKHLSSKTVDLLKITAEIDDTHYPESLRKLYFIRTPSLFSVFYKAITPFLDKRTISKLKIVSSNKLNQVLDKQVPNKYCRPAYLNHWVDDDGKTFPCILCNKENCLPLAGKVITSLIPSHDSIEMVSRKHSMKKIFSKKKMKSH